MCLSVAMLSVTPMAMAETGDNTSTSDTVTKTEITNSADSAEDSAGRSARLEKFKTDYKVKLSALETANLKQKCKPAQTVVKSVQERVNSGSGNRTKAYGKITDHLSGLLVKLKAKGVDTTKLEQEINELKAKVAQHDTDLAAYKQAVSDLKLLDCATDPAAFKAALLAARADRDKVVKDVADIRAYLKDTIKPTLQAIRAALDAGQDTNEGGEN